MDLKKNIRLPQDEAMVTVDYKFTNLPAAMADVEYGYWCQNFIGIPGKKKTVSPLHERDRNSAG
jgi:hypothetical protein